MLFQKHMVQSAQTGRSKGRPILIVKNIYKRGGNEMENEMLLIKIGEILGEGLAETRLGFKKMRDDFAKVDQQFEEMREGFARVDRQFEEVNRKQN